MPFVSPAFRKFCLPYVPATNVQISNVLRLMRQHSAKDGSVIDLGSGDGRVVFAVARTFTECSRVCGVELNYPLVLYSRFRYIMEKNILYPPVHFIHGNLWHVNADYDTTVVFGVDSMMSQLEEKLSHTKSGSIVITCRYPLPTWCHVDHVADDIDSVWCYRIA